MGCCVAGPTIYPLPGYFEISASRGKLLHQSEKPRLLLVANPGEVHLGAHLVSAAKTLDLPLQLIDVNDALSSNKWINRFHYHLNGRSAAHMRRFSRAVFEACRLFKPTLVLVTGISPVDAKALQQINALGIRAVNFLTDDPFNPVHRAPWFFRAMPEYSCIFSPRRANIADLRSAGCRDVRYLPFAYAPEIHFPEDAASTVERNALSSDVFFAGGADGDRIGYMVAMMKAGLNVALYGGYWGRHAETKPAARGFADAAMVRKAAAAAKVSICLVRRANRDGHSMRTFELPAMKACMVVEDTPEHRNLFGPEGECVAYFNSAEELVRRSRCW